MIPAQEIKALNDNADRYILALFLLEKLSKEKKINKKQEKEMEKKIKFSFSKNYWKLNPFIKDKELLYKMSISFLERYDLARSYLDEFK